MAVSQSHSYCGQTILGEPLGGPTFQGFGGAGNACFPTVTSTIRTTVSGSGVTRAIFSRQSQALQQSYHEFYKSLKLCEHHTMNSPRVSGSATTLLWRYHEFYDNLTLRDDRHPEFVDSLKLCTDPWQNPQALRPLRQPAMARKAPWILRESQAPCTPKKIVVGRLRLCAPPLIILSVCLSDCLPVCRLV